MDWIAHCRQQVIEAFERLTVKGLVPSPGAEFSVRVPGQAAMAVAQLCCSHSEQNLTAARTRGQDTSATRVEAPALGARPEISVVVFEAAAHPPLLDAPMLWLHAEVYRHRPDVGGILISPLPWGSRLASRGGTMPAVFDEQVRHLGPRVERLVLQGTRMEESAISNLKRGANAFLIERGVLCLGSTGARAVLNAELLEKCAQAFILASLARRPVRVIPSYVRLIATMRLRKDEKRASRAYARGESPDRLRAY